MAVRKAKEQSATAILSSVKKRPSAKAILAAVKKEMARPRVAMSAR
jgi:hypothetical protein